MNTPDVNMKHGNRTAFGDGKTIKCTLFQCASANCVYPNIVIK